MKFHYFLIFSILIFSVSCGHHRDVRPGAEGVHRVSLKAGEEDEGAQNAIRQANHFCEQRGMTAAFISEEKKYTGDMDEKNYKNVRRVGKVAQVVGGGAYVLGNHRKTQNLGGLGALGGTAAHAVASDGYTVDMKFKCI